MVWYKTTRLGSTRKVIVGDFKLPVKSFKGAVLPVFVDIHEIRITARCWPARLRRYEGVGSVC